MRSPAINQWYILDVLAANSRLSRELWAFYLYHQPLSPNLHTALENYQNGISDRREMESDLQSALNKEQVLERNLIRAYMQGDSLNRIDLFNIESLLAAQSENDALRTRMAVAKAYGDYSTANALLNDYTDKGNDAYVPVQTILNAVQDDVFALDQAALDQLSFYANSDMGNSGLAQAALAIQGDSLFEQEIIPPLNYNSLIAATPLKSYEQNEILQIFPNPVQDELTFTFDLPQDVHNLEFNIRDFLGKIVLRKQADNSSSFVIWDIEELKPGIYLLDMLVNGEFAASTKFIKE